MLFGLIWTCGCGEPDDTEGIKKIAETGGDEGLHIPDVDLPAEGEPPVLLPPGECVQLPEPGAFGYTHQCDGRTRLSVHAQGETYDEHFDFGPGQINTDYWLDPDSYDLPLVAACCGPFNYQAPTLAEKLPYINNCLIDSVQQICHALPYLIRRQAELADREVVKIAMQNLADDVEAREGECMVGLWGNGGTEESPNRILGTSWSPRDAVTITLIETEVNDWTEEGDVAWDTCESIHDNDPAVIPTAPIHVPGIIGLTQATLAPGASMSGTGPAGFGGMLVPSPDASLLTVATMSDGSLRITGLHLESGPTTVGSGDLQMMLERSSLELRDVMTPHSEGREYVVDGGDAHFVATAVFEGGSRTIDFTNVDPIALRETVTGDWEFDPFDLVYAEPGIGSWTLSFDGMLFVTDL